MAGERDERGVTDPPAVELGPETRMFLQKLMEYQVRIKDAVRLAIACYDELGPEAKARVKGDLDKAGGVLMFGGLMLPEGLRKELGVDVPMETMHGVSGGGQFRETYPGGISLSGNNTADVVLAVNLLMNLGPVTGVDGMLLLNAALGAIHLTMMRHLGVHKVVSLAVLEGMRQQHEAAQEEINTILLARSKETGSA